MNCHRCLWKIVVVVMFCFSVLACSAGDSSGTSSNGFSHNLGLTISGSRSFNTSTIHGQIDHYRMTVTGDDIHKEITQDFGGTTDLAQMGGVPVGPNRTISVEALNPNGLVIRRGKAEGVTITAGVFSNITIVMHAVPIFTNITDKSAVAGRRLGLTIFGEPGSSLEVLRTDGGQSEMMSDQSVGNVLLDTTATDGLFKMDPADLDPGVHTFRIHDRNSDEYSEVTLTIYDSLVRPGVAVNAGGNAQQLQDELVISGFGQPYYNEVMSGAANLGNTALLDVVDLLY